jgi:truncated hemoglobin YjbI
VLEPIFAEHIDDWEIHIAKLCDFWSSVALLTGRYHGTPMAAHLPMAVGAREFACWLAIFTETAKEVCPLEAASYFIERANRIAGSLALGVAASRGQIIAGSWSGRATIAREAPLLRHPRVHDPTREAGLPAGRSTSELVAMELLCRFPLPRRACVQVVWVGPAVLRAPALMQSSSGS